MRDTVIRLLLTLVLITAIELDIHWFTDTTEEAIKHLLIFLIVLVLQIMFSVTDLEK